jgi:hypothetical protein
MFIGPEKGYVNHNCLARDPYSLPLLLEAYPPIHVAMTTTSLTECFTNNIKSYLASVSMPATGLNSDTQKLYKLQKTYCIKIAMKLTHRNQNIQIPTSTSIFFNKLTPGQSILCTVGQIKQHINYNNVSIAVQ